MKLWTVKTLIELQLDFVCLGIPIFEVSTFSEVMLCCSGLCTFCKTNMELATHIILPKFGIDLLINSLKFSLLASLKRRHVHELSEFTALRGAQLQLFWSLRRLVRSLLRCLINVTRYNVTA